MHKERFFTRLVSPVLLVFIFTAVSWSIYMLSPEIPNYSLYQIVAVVSGIVLFISLGFGALYVYYFAHVRGARPVERIIAALISPVIWMTKEVVVIATVYTIPEALYYYLNPVNLLLLAAVVAEMGMAELLARRALKKRGAVKHVFTFAAVSAVVLGIGWVVSMFAWGLGVHHFYIFQEGFKALFGYGAGL